MFQVSSRTIMELQTLCNSGKHVTCQISTIWRKTCSLRLLEMDDGNENDDPGWTLVTTSKKRKPMKSKRSLKASKVCTGYTSSSEMRSYDRERIQAG